MGSVSELLQKNYNLKYKRSKKSKKDVDYTLSKPMIQSSKDLKEKD